MKKGLFLVLTLGILSFTEFISSPCLFAAQKFPFIAEAVTDDVNVRAGQSESFERIAKLKKGETVVVVAKNFTWYQIKLPLQTETFVSSDFVQDLGEGIASIKADRVNVRSGKGVNFVVLGQLKKGTFVRILNSTAGWYKIEPPEGVFGWIADKFLKFQSNNVPPAHSVQPDTRNGYKLKHIAEQAAVTQPAAEPVAPTPAKKPVAPVANVTKPVEQQPAQPVAPVAPQPAVVAANVPAAQPTAVQTKTGDVAVIGYIEDAGDKVPVADIRYKLVVDLSTAYFLKGQNEAFRWFYKSKVQVEGRYLPEIQSEIPVIEVTNLSPAFEAYN